MSAIGIIDRCALGQQKIIHHMIDVVGNDGDVLEVERSIDLVHQEEQSRVNSYRGHDKPTLM